MVYRISGHTDYCNKNDLEAKKLHLTFHATQGKFKKRKEKKDKRKEKKSKKGSYLTPCVETNKNYMKKPNTAI